MAQVLRVSASKHDALSSNSNAAKKQKKTTKQKNIKLKILQMNFLKKLLGEINNRVESLKRRNAQHPWLQRKCKSK
jgi:FMN-dependent NADH-azoreductase